MMRKTFVEKYGPYAMVTGASAGLGEEFAVQLAGRGLNLVLVARRKDKLAELGARLERAHGIKVIALGADLADEKAVAELERATDGIEVGMVVLNAGVLTGGAFLDNEERAEDELLKVNVVAPMRLAHSVGRKLKSRGRGGMIFLSSVVGYQIAPYLANYAASKAYMASFGLALREELNPYGIDVTVLAPGPTKTEGVQAAPGSVGINFSKLPLPQMAPVAVVRAAIEGLAHNKAIVIPGLMNKITDLSAKYVMSRSFGARMFATLMRRTLVQKRQRDSGLKVDSTAVAI